MYADIHTKFHPDLGILECEMGELMQEAEVQGQVGLELVTLVYCGVDNEEVVVGRWNRLAKPNI